MCYQLPHSLGTTFCPSPAKDLLIIQNLMHLFLCTVPTFSLYKFSDASALIMDFAFSYSSCYMLFQVNPLLVEVNFLGGLHTSSVDVQNFSR